MPNLVCTITPNPALDLGGVVDRLVPNEKAYVHDETKFPGGNAINVARILTRLGVPVFATGFLGGAAGEEIKDLLSKEKVSHRFVPIQGHTRVNVTVSNRQSQKQTRLSFPGPHISKKEKIDLEKLVQKTPNISLLVIGGSLPPGFSTKDIQCLLKIAKEKKVRAIVDCPGKTLKDVLAHQPFLIKPNLEEFQELLGTRVKSIGAVRKKAESLLDRVPVICVSSVDGGALLVTREGSFFGRIPAVKINSTVGAGDSMVGAMAAELCKYELSMEEVFKWGLAAAAATLSQPGTTLGSGKLIRELHQKTKVETLF